jgi:valyl-tRNA synthetase
MVEQLDKVYDPAKVEAYWYNAWEEHGLFKAQADPDKKPYCITIPPPNVTGELHMGHAIQHAIHDAVIRFKRMQGYETLCLPGTDHAGIATQMKVEEQLAREEGKSRYDVGRQELERRIWAWKEKYGNAIYDQLRQLGASYDWDRARFTLDDDYVEAVLQAFTRFQEKGWIYRGTRMINWCPKCGTVISDLETEERLLDGHLWHIRYPGIDGAPDVVVATTRPETMLGDTAVAVHPDDERWRDAVGKQVLLPLAGRPIPIVADSYADPAMGSGAVKVTPAHDPNDYEIGKRHDLPQKLVIDFDGSMGADAGEYAGLDRYECRKQVIAALEEKGLLVKVEDHQHAVPHHDKCGTVIEPLPMEQWFMNMEALAQKARPYLANSEIRYVPDRFRGYGMEWLDNIRDWALSRQIWWGHRIPAWYCRKCSADGLIPLGDLEREAALQQGAFRVSIHHGAKPLVSASRPGACAECGGDEWVQDPDVLDTWFSSALWPFATLGWPQTEKDLAYFHPTDLMITARDILYLWVLRMAMTSIECIGTIPFKTVLVHPTVLTKDGRRMSKSLGTGLNPLDLVRLYGADATRFSLLHQAGAVQDVRFDAEIEDNKVTSSQSAEMGRNFCNKLWNAARFVLMHLEDADPALMAAGQDAAEADLADRWIRSRLVHTSQRVSAAMEEYRFSEATRALYDFIWRDYCDWYLEMVKGRLFQGGKARAQVQITLVEVLESALRLLHPIMPFITEAIWQTLPFRAAPADEPSVAHIMVATWPADLNGRDAGSEEELELIQEVVTAVRTIRSEMNIPPATKVEVIIDAGTPQVAAVLQANAAIVAQLARAEKVETAVGASAPQVAAGSAVLKEAAVYVPLAGLIDLEVERQRLGKELKKLQGLVKSLDGKLSNAKFLEKAPEAVVEKERQRREEYRANIQQLEAGLERLEGLES